MTPMISIITVGMNHLSYLENLLFSLYKKYPPATTFELIYVDNCSSDNSISFIEVNYPEVIILKNSNIKGFSENNNYAISKSRGRIIALINPDIVVLKGSIDVLYEKLINNDQIGIVVPKLLNKDLTLQYSVRKYITLKILFHRLVTRGDDKVNNTKIKDYLCKNMNYEIEQPIDWAIGAAMLFRKETFNKLNGFDEDYFLYMEDEDLCLRTWKIGKSVMYCPDSTMIHNHLRGSSKLSKKTYLHIKSLFTFFIKHGVNIQNNIK